MNEIVPHSVYIRATVDCLVYHSCGIGGKGMPLEAARYATVWPTTTTEIQYDLGAMLRSRLTQTTSANKSERYDQV